MNVLKIISIAFILTIVNGCNSKPKGSVGKMHWDRDMCERCKMAISERKYAVEAIDIKNNKTYRFDDIGCTVLWMSENKIPIDSNIKLWITDAKTGKWIDAKSAIYTDDSITPMAYGFASYTKETLPKNHHTIDFKSVEKRVFEIEKLNTQKVNSQ